MTYSWTHRLSKPQRLNIMGIPMDDNIHGPTVVSGPTSGGIARNLSNLSMAELMQEKERIEAELTTLSNVLSSVGLYCRGTTLIEGTCPLIIVVIAWCEYEFLLNNI